jgi:bacteriorhodopsin
MVTATQLYNKSYEVTFIMMVCITVLTYIRSIQTNPESKYSLALQLSSFVTMIASMHYYLMIQNKNNVHTYRYFDWFFTTPVLLIELCLLLDIFDIQFLAEIILYNTLMLLIGFAGEVGYLGLMTSTAAGFLPLLLMFWRIKSKVDAEQTDRVGSEAGRIRKNTIINTFFGLWSAYGVNNLVTNRMVSNGVFNILDFLTKGAFGLFIYSETL